MRNACAMTSSESRITYHALLRFFVRAMRPALIAELFELKTIRRLLLILRREVIAVLAFSALQRDVISRHKSSFQPVPASRLSDAGTFSNQLQEPDRRP